VDRHTDAAKTIPARCSRCAGNDDDDDKDTTKMENLAKYTIFIVLAK